MEITEKRSDVVMFSFVVYDFSSCVDDMLKLLEAVISMYTVMYNAQISPKIFGLHYWLFRNKYIFIIKEKSKTLGIIF